MEVIRRNDVTAWQRNFVAALEAAAPANRESPLAAVNA